MFSSYLICGHEADPLISCAKILLERGHPILGIVSTGSEISAWAKSQSIPHTSPTPKKNLINFFNQPFDYIFSIYSLTILPQEILHLPAKLPINLHDAYLPTYAGLNAPSWVILNGEKHHGVTWHVMTNHLDGGNIIKQVKIDLADNETGGTLYSKCYEATITSFGELIEELEGDRISQQPQDLSKRSIFATTDKPCPGCLISWNKSAKQIERFIRALDLHPHPNFLGLPKIAINGQFIIVSQLSILDSTSEQPPGTLIKIEEDTLQISTATEDIVLQQLLTIDGKILVIKEFVAQFDLRPGYLFQELKPEIASKIEQLETGLSKYEISWFNHWKDLQQLQLTVPPVEIAINKIQSQEWIVPQQMADFLAHDREKLTFKELIVTAFALYLAKITQTYSFDIGLKDWRIETEIGILNSLFADCVPCHLSLEPETSFPEACETVTKQLAKTYKRKTYERDIAVRYPELHFLREKSVEQRFPIAIAFIKKIANLEPDNIQNQLTFLICEAEKNCFFYWNEAKLSQTYIQQFINEFTLFVENLF